MIDKKLIFKLSALAGSFAILWGAVAIALPLLRSDPPPFVGQSKLEQYAASLDQLQQFNKKLQDHQTATDQTLDMIRLEQIENAMNHAKDDLLHNPASTSARRDVCAFIDQADKIRTRLGLPIIPVCK